MLTKPMRIDMQYLKFGFLIALFVITTIAHVDGAKTIEGSVFYRERVMLPPNAEIQITLEDVSKMDVAADVISTIVFRQRVVHHGYTP